MFITFQHEQNKELKLVFFSTSSCEITPELSLLLALSLSLLSLFSRGTELPQATRKLL
uniref:Uncharacterized protein n=1 Tax=Anguilla anguilla TaxID=7936 RepID=A0A0E9XA14_ANGAN